MSRPAVQSAKPEIQIFFAEGFECYNRHDFDAMLEIYAEDAVLDVSRIFLDENPRQGREDVRAYWDQMWDISGGMRGDPVEVLDVGDGRYVVVVAFGMVGKLSGVDVTGSAALLCTLCDGLIARLDLFTDREQALKAVGLEE
jgi:ketosteroid isomerase-like protein